ncbi:MAG: hypothetical protein V7646_6662, partial [Pseudonocardia sp.]
LRGIALIVALPVLITSMRKVTTTSTR